MPGHPGLWSQVTMRHRDEVAARRVRASARKKGPSLIHEGRPTFCHLAPGTAHPWPKSKQPITMTKVEVTVPVANPRFDLPAFLKRRLPGINSRAILRNCFEVDGSFADSKN